MSRITVDHVSYIEPKSKLDTDLSRLYFIAKAAPRNEGELSIVRGLSAAWQYHRVLGCRYPPAYQRRLGE